MKTSMVCDNTAPTEAFGEKRFKITPQARESPIMLWLRLSEAVSISQGAKTVGRGHWQGPTLLSRLVPRSERTHGDEKLGLKFKDSVKCQSVLKS